METYYTSPDQSWFEFDHYRNLSIGFQLLGKSNWDPIEDIREMGNNASDNHVYSLGTCDWFVNKYTKTLGQIEINPDMSVCIAVEDENETEIYYENICELIVDWDFVSEPWNHV